MDNSPSNHTQSLVEKQARFAQMVALLIQEADRLEYMVTFGDAYRDPRTNGAQGIKAGYGAAKSAHKWRLAVDLALFRGGVYLRDTADYEPLAGFWRALGGTWGGDWQDGNHFSVEHQGIK